MFIFFLNHRPTEITDGATAKANATEETEEKEDEGYGVLERDPTAADGAGRLIRISKQKSPRKPGRYSGPIDHEA